MEIRHEPSWYNKEQLPYLTSTDLLDVKLIKENKLGGCQRRKLFFVVPGWFMPYFHLLPFVNNKKYGEGEMSRVVVFVYVFAFNVTLTISPLEVC